MSTALLEPTVLRRLEALRRRQRGTARSGATGETAASRRGSGAEFREHRPYVPGDDARRVDWMAYARTGEPVIKLYRADEDRMVRLLLDGSASMGFGSPSKLLVAQRLAAAMGYLALVSSERAQVFLARDSQGATGLDAQSPAHRGRSAFAALCRELSAIRAEGRTDLARSVDTVLLRSSRPGLLAVLSDFFDAGPLLKALTRARAAGHDVVLIQILDNSELEPALEGDLALEDAETGQVLDVTADPAALAAYEAALATVIEGLSVWARKHGALHIRATTADAVEETIDRIMAQTSD